MPANLPQMINITCPACRTPYTSPVVSIVDVGQDPRLKTLFLQGRLNTSVCPNCGAGGIVNIPLAYHDPEKEVLFCLVPQEMNIRETERQRIIGEMSRAVLNQLPTEQRKGYLLQPRIFLTYQTMIEAILEKDGISKEMLQARQRKADLAERMMQMVDDPITLSSAINENKDQIDQEFFVLLMNRLQMAQQSNQEDTAQKLQALYDKLIELTPAGQELARQQELADRVFQDLDQDMTHETLLERIMMAEGELDDSFLQLLISIARPLIDYQFFQLLTERMNQAQQSQDTATADRLKALRAKVLDLTQKIDVQARETMEEKAKLISEIAQSEDPKAFIRTHIDQIDDSLLSVLEMNIQANMQQNRQQAAQALAQVRDIIVQVIRESMPPELQFIEQLLAAEYPDETRQLLQQNPAMVTPQLVATIKLLMQQTDQEDKQYTLLQQILAQAELQVGLSEQATPNIARP